MAICLPQPSTSYLTIESSRIILILCWLVYCYKLLGSSTWAELFSALNWYFIILSMSYFLYLHIFKSKAHWVTIKGAAFEFINHQEHKSNSNLLPRRNIFANPCLQCYSDLIYVIRQKTCEQGASQHRLVFTVTAQKQEDLNFSCLSPSTQQTVFYHSNTHNLATFILHRCS